MARSHALACLVVRGRHPVRTQWRVSLFAVRIPFCTLGRIPRRPKSQARSHALACLAVRGPHPVLHCGPEFPKARSISTNHIDYLACCGCSPAAVRAFIGCRIGQNLLDDWAQNMFAASRPSSGESRLPYSRHKQIPKVSSTNPSLSESDRGGWYLIPLVFWGVAIYGGSSLPR